MYSFWEKKKLEELAFAISLHCHLHFWPPDPAHMRLEMSHAHIFMFPGPWYTPLVYTLIQVAETVTKLHTESNSHNLTKAQKYHHASYPLSI